MNNNNVFLQLRELEERNIPLDRINGNFNIKLKRPLILNEGDELLVNKAIIDTRSLDSDKIILQNDINIQINFCYYLLNDITTNKLNANADAPWAAGDLDYELYVLAIPTAPGPPVETFDLKQIKFKNPDTPGKSSNWPSWSVTMQYSDVNDQTRTIHIKMTLEESSTNPDQMDWVSDVSTYGISKVDQFYVATLPKDLQRQGIYGNYGKTELTVTHDIQTKDSFTPYINNFNIKMSKGDYNYSDFADRINQEITFINSNDTLTELSPGGTNTLLLNSGHPTYDTAGTGLAQKGAIWIRSTDGAKGFKLLPKSLATPGPKDQTYFGTNQFVILFDEITNRFFFKYLNMPIYEGASGNESIKFETFGGNIKLTNKSSGVLIDSIITTDLAMNIQIDLFSQILGFDMGGLNPKFESVKNDTLTGASARSFKCSLSDGKNTTGGLSSLDVIVQKKAPAPTPPAVAEQNLYKYTPALVALGYILVDQQNEIYAEKAVGLGASLNFGYYIIAIDGLQGDFITSDDIKNNIFAIISRYYSSNNYTIGSPDDAIIYTHRGQTQVLNNLNVRILDGNFRIIGNLGNDNTLFLQHRKSKVPLDAIQLVEQEKKQKK